MIHTVVIEDEIEIQDFIVSLLTRYCDGIQIVGTAGSIEQAKVLIDKKKPDLVFLDVELEDGKAFEILECFNSHDFVTILLTGYSKYGIDGVKYGVSDYLLKPIILKELIESVKKAKQKVVDKSILRKLHNHSSTNEIEGRILVQKTDKSKILLNYSEILNWEGEQGFTRIYLTNNQNFLLKDTLKSFCERLPPFFIRIHRSHAVNLNFVRSYSINRNGWVKLQNGETLPVSTRNKRTFLKAINSFIN